MATGLDTLCGQAFGAGRHRLLGVHKQRAMLVLTLLSVPVAGVWACAGEILAWCGQDPEIAAAAGSYTRWLIPALLVYAPLQCHVRFLQAQKLVLPVMLSSGAAALGHPAVCWLLVRRLGLGSRGVALANAVSYLGNLSLMALYVRLSAVLQDHMDGLLRRGVPRYPRPPEARRAFCCHDLVTEHLMQSLCDGSNSIPLLKASNSRLQHGVVVL
jgi:multidrug resistance protein, MATE family